MRRGDESHLAEDVRRWQRILFERGWGAAMWPSEFGGTGWDKTRQYLFDIECFAADAPIQLPFGLKMVAPVIMRYGSEAQKARSSRGSSTPAIGGARAIPNRAVAPTSLR